MLKPGTVIRDRYQLQRQLGHNAVRQTWLATDIISDPPASVVVKLLTFGANAQWDDLKLFEREAQVLRQLDHPRIPKCRDYFAIDDRVLWFGLVEDYIPGDSLKELLDQGRKFTEAEVIQIATALLDILIYLHGLSPPVLHRDIKPSNLILHSPSSSDETIGELYLVDFGAVQDKATAEGKTFTVTGTYGYTPMEQFGGRAIAASDLYALGATLIHLLTGISPANLPQDEELRIVFQDRTSASPALVNWIRQLTEPSWKQRIATAEHARQTLTLLQAVPGALVHPGSRGTDLTVESNLKPATTRIRLSRISTSLRIELPPVTAAANQQPRTFIAESDDVSGVLSLLLGALFLLFILGVWGLQAGYWLVSFSAFSIAFLGFLAAVFLFSPSPPCWVTQLILKPQEFTINTYLRRESRAFGMRRELKHWRRGITANIDSCYAEDVETYNRTTQAMIRIPSVAIVERINDDKKLEKYTIGSGILTRAEAQWLASEINQWLHPGKP